LPFRDAQAHFQDILNSIALINHFVAGMGFESYKNDLKTKSAVERQLQILTEAAYRLGNEAEVLCPGLNWKGFMGMGNVLRHGYHKVDDQIVWDTVKTDLPALREAVSIALQKLLTLEDHPSL
jgi:uncharacterized protein with HEPN domain